MDKKVNDKREIKKGDSVLIYSGQKCVLLWFRCVYVPHVNRVSILAAACTLRQISHKTKPAGSI